MYNVGLADMYIVCAAKWVQYCLFLAEDFEQPSVSESDDHAPEWEGLDGTGSGKMVKYNGVW